MSQYSKLVLNGEATTAKDWEEHLKEVHKLAPGMTPVAFLDFLDESGINSYQRLAETIKSEEANAYRVLDLACGDGYLIPHILKINPDISILGVDMSEGELSIAKKNYQGSNIEFKCENANSISEPDSSFDCVLSHMAMMLMNPIGPVLAELNRVLKPNGRLSAIVGGGIREDNFDGKFRSMNASFLKENYPNFKRPSTGDEKVRSVEGIKSAFREYGFSDIEVNDFVVSYFCPLENVWDIYKDMYFVSILPLEQQLEFRGLLDAEASKDSEDGKIRLEFSKRQIEAKNCG